MPEAVCKPAPLCQTVVLGKNCNKIHLGFDYRKVSSPVLPSLNLFSTGETGRPLGSRRVSRLYFLFSVLHKYLFNTRSVKKFHSPNKFPNQ